MGSHGTARTHANILPAWLFLCLSVHLFACLFDDSGSGSGPDPSLAVFVIYLFVIYHMFLRVLSALSVSAFAGCLCFPAASSGSLSTPPSPNCVNRLAGKHFSWPLAGQQKDPLTV